MALSADGLFITWPVVPGKTYRVEYKDTLDDGPWTALGSRITATNTSLMMNDATGPARQRFYRVIQIDS